MTDQEICREDVQAAVAALLESGEPVTTRSIRHQLGHRCSLSTIAKHLEAIEIDAAPTATSPAPSPRPPRTVTRQDVERALAELEAMGHRFAQVDGEGTMLDEIDVGEDEEEDAPYSINAPTFGAALQMAIWNDRFMKAFNTAYGCNFSYDDFVAPAKPAKRAESLRLLAFVFDVLWVEGEPLDAPEHDIDPTTLT
jgi:hypothetical protein